MMQVHIYTPFGSELVHAATEPPMPAPPAQQPLQQHGRQVGSCHCSQAA